MKSTRPLRLVIISLSASIAAGCAQSAHQRYSPTAVYVEGEVVQQTGSRISHVVRKGGPAGIAEDRPGMVSGTGRIEHEQNDMLSQYGR